ncbi:MAG: Coenzyme F420 hydrogenase/dehydrogenase, beta subunit C-terminal domain [Bacteroidaceae bacterium]|nr:Coenzyme F420 hydrogenase/dehydrogenase, beta subunit C-terminal domain [Bacteroidaceae bacterium]
MIHITEPKNCCGCNACVQACPKHCIRMQEDSEGFLYPFVDRESCIDCGLCERVCPVINQNEPQKPVVTLAAINSDESVRLASSSGGIFTLLAERTIDNGGVVFGAAFDENWDVKHICIDSKSELPKLRGSKYVQSTIGNCYKEAKTHLSAGKEVLFTGTPCQIASLKKFLRKDYKNLKTMDIVCHGTPSPLVWRKYLDEVSSMYNIAQITDIQFRDKTEGWKNFSLSIKYKDKEGVEKTFRETLNENIFMRCFLSNLCLRPSCYACPARNGKSGSDITLADLWGAENISPESDDDKGVSLVLLRNKDFTLPGFVKKEIEYSKAVMYNPSIESDVTLPDKRDRFFRLLHSDGIHKATVKCTTKSRFEVLIEKIIWNIKNRILK